MVSILLQIGRRGLPYFLMPTLMDTTKAFARRRKLSAIIWMTLAACAALSALQMIFGFSILSAVITLLLGVLAWSERRACRLFAAQDPRGGWVGFGNQLILGILGAAYLFWSARAVPDLQAQFALPEDTADVILPLIREGYLICGALILVSQIFIALYDLRVTTVPPTSSPKMTGSGSDQ